VNVALGATTTGWQTGGPVLFSGKHVAERKFNCKISRDVMWSKLNNAKKHPETASSPLSPPSSLLPTLRNQVMPSLRHVGELTDSILLCGAIPSFIRSSGPSHCLRLWPNASARHASSASSTRWKTRQSRDHFSREAKVKGLKSRAAFKLLEVFHTSAHVAWTVR